jgi:hypothetical protein
MFDGELQKAGRALTSALAHSLDARRRRLYFGSR